MTVGATDIPLAKLSGKYSNPGYGSVELCSIRELTDESQYCAITIKAFNSSAFPDYDQGLVAAWPRFWASHLAMQPFNGSTCEHQFFYTSAPLLTSCEPPVSMTFMSLYPEGHGKNKTGFYYPFAYAYAPPVFGQFATDPTTGNVTGFGMYDMPGDLTDQQSEEDIKATA